MVMMMPSYISYLTYHKAVFLLQCSVIKWQGTLLLYSTFSMMMLD